MDLKSEDYQNILLSKDYINGIILNIVLRRLRDMHVRDIRRTIFSELEDCIGEINELMQQKRNFSLKI